MSASQAGRWPVESLGLSTVYCLLSTACCRLSAVSCLLPAAPQPSPDCQPHVIGAFLLQPDMTRVVVGELDDQRALVFRQGGGDLLDQLLLPLNIDRREQLVLVDDLQQLLVFVLALLFGIREGGHVADLAL